MMLKESIFFFLLLIELFIINLFDLFYLLVIVVHVNCFLLYAGEVLMGLLFWLGKITNINII